MLRTLRQFPFIRAFLIVALFISITLTASAKSIKAPPVSAHRFFAFDDAPYFNSADRRIGVKLLVDSTKVGPTLAALQHMTYLPQGHIKSHRHVYVTEILFVLKGTLTLRIGPDVKQMGPNTVAYIPPQIFHEYLNDSTDVVEFLQFYSPSGPEEEYRNWERPETVKVDAPAKDAKKTKTAQPAPAAKPAQATVAQPTGKPLAKPLLTPSTSHPAASSAVRLIPAAPAKPKPVTKAPVSQTKRINPASMTLELSGSKGKN